METRQTYVTDTPVPPGVYLQEVLEEFGMSQADLARRLGRPAQTVNEIIGGKKALTAATALELEQVLAVPAYMWNGLEAAYQLAKARQREQGADVAADLELLPQCGFYHELVLRGAARATRDKQQQVLELRRFFGVTALRNVQDLYQPAFRLASKQQAAASPYALAAWLRLGELKAGNMQVGPCNLEGLQALLPGLRQLTLKPLAEALPGLVDQLAQAGLACVALKALPGSGACGAAFWWRRRKPVVLVSDYGKSEDKFWFSLLHELAHIVLHGSARVFVNLDQAGDPWSTVQLEREADQLARDMLLPEELYRSFTWRWRYPQDDEIHCFAAAAGVHAGIVAGRLCRDGVIGWQRMRKFARPFQLGGS